MSAAAPPSPPPPPPPRGKSNQPPDYIGKGLELTQDAKNKGKKHPRTRWRKHFKPPESSKLDNPCEHPRKSSPIRQCLEAKLEQQPHSSSGEGSSSSPRVSDSENVLEPLPVRAVKGPETQSIMLGPSDGSSRNLIIAVYDQILEKWLFMSVDDYIARFGAIVAIPQKDLTELKLSCIDTLQRGFSLVDVTQNKEEENNVLHAEDKEEKLTEDRDKVEKDVSREKKEEDKVEENVTEEKEGEKLEENVADEKKEGDKVEENVTGEKEEGDKVEEDGSEEKVEGDKVEENVAKEKNEKELKVHVHRSKMKPMVKAVQFGEIELQVSLKKSEKVTINPTRSAPSSSANAGDGTVNKEPDELPLARVVGNGQGSHGGHDQKKGKKKKKKKKNKNKSKGKKK